MSVIHKFEIDLDDTVTVNTHPVLRWLSVAEQRGKVCVWAEVDDSQQPDFFVLYVRGTGHPMTGDEGEHVGTVLLAGGSLVFHIFAHKSHGATS